MTHGLMKSSPWVNWRQRDVMLATGSAIGLLVDVGERLLPGVGLLANGLGRGGLRGLEFRLGGGELGRRRVRAGHLLDKHVQPRVGLHPRLESGRGRTGR